MSAQKPACSQYKTAAGKKARPVSLRYLLHRFALDLPAFCPACLPSWTPRHPEPSTIWGPTAAKLITNPPPHQESEVTFLQQPLIVTELILACVAEKYPDDCALTN